MPGSNYNKSRSKRAALSWTTTIGKRCHNLFFFPCVFMFLLGKTRDAFCMAKRNYRDTLTPIVQFFCRGKKKYAWACAFSRPRKWAEWGKTGAKAKVSPDFSLSDELGEARLTFLKSAYSILCKSPNGIKHQFDGEAENPWLGSACRELWLV